MAFDATLVWGNFATYQRPNGDPGAGTIYLGHAIRKTDELGNVVGPGLLDVEVHTAKIIMATGFFKVYRKPWRDTFVKMSERHIRSMVSTYMTERATHVPTDPPTFATAWEAIDQFLRGGWGHSMEMARELESALQVEGPWDLKHIAGLVGMGDKIQPIKDGCKHLAQCIVESFMVDDWYADGHPDLPFLWSTFEHEDGHRNRKVRDDELIDPSVGSSWGGAYNWLEVERGATILWAWLNQKIVAHVIEKVNLVDSSRNIPSGMTG